jgi:bloom syndrome protein
VASHDEDRDEDVGISSNGYTRDGFVVDDDEHSEDDFEPVPPLARRRQMDSIGPPISRDARLSDESLTEVQKDILESFFKEAQILEEKVRVSRTHRQPIFSQLQLREMGLRWTVTLDQMRRIPGIDRDAVDRHGDRLLPLIQRYHQRYQEIMGVLPEPRAMPSLGEIVDLVSTDDEEEDDDMEGIEDYDDVDDDDEEGRETSGYFGPPVGERKFMDKMKTIQRTDPQDQQGAASKSGGRASGSGTRTRGKSNWRGGRKQHAPRRSSGSKFAGVKKKGVAAKRTTSSQGARGARAASQSRTAAPRGKGGRLEASGFEGIGLMDH